MDGAARDTGGHMGSLETPGRDDHPDRPAEVAAPAEAPRATAGQNVERTSAAGLATAISQDDKSGPADIDFEAYDPKHPRGTLLVVGQTGSTDDPKRLAYEGKGDKVHDVPPSNKPIPDDPSGQDLTEVFDDDDKPTYDRVRDKASSQEFIEGLQDSGKGLGQTAWEAVQDRPKATGAYVGTPNEPAVNAQTQGSPDLGLLAPLSVLAWIGSERTAQFIRKQFNELRQSRGDRPDGDN
ncbi:hypothetical protein [Flindersiella endophytica]